MIARPNTRMTRKHESSAAEETAPVRVEEGPLVRSLSPHSNGPVFRVVHPINHRTLRRRSYRPESVAAKTVVYIDEDRSLSEWERVWAE